LEKERKGCSRVQEVSAADKPPSFDSSSSSTSGVKEWHAESPIQHSHCNFYVPYDPKNEILEDIVVTGYSIRVSQGEIRRARHPIYDIQQLVMKTDSYMLN
jgi:hypothetical protein